VQEGGQLGVLFLDPPEIVLLQLARGDLTVFQELDELDGGLAMHRRYFSSLIKFTS
jgi:hypothetical protein